MMNANMALDMGSANVRISVTGRGMMLEQSTAFATRGSTVLRGDDAYALIGRTTNGMEITFPLRADAITDEAAFADWIRYLIETAQSSGVVNKPRLLIARPAGMQRSQIRRMAALTMEAGANACALIRSDICAALGASIPIDKPNAQLVVDVGAGMISSSVICRSHVIREDSIPFGMDRIDAAIVRMLLAKYYLRVGETTAESVKKSLATAASGADLTEQIVGIDGESGFPKTIMVDLSDIEACIAPLLSQVAEMAESLTRGLNPEMVVDLMGSGIVLTGGGAQIYGLDKIITQLTELPCRVADQPHLCVLNGLEKVMDNMGDYQTLIEEHQTILEKRLSVMRR